MAAMEKENSTLTMLPLPDSGDSPLPIMALQFSTICPTQFSPASPAKIKFFFDPVFLVLVFSLPGIVAT